MDNIKLDTFGFFRPRDFSPRRIVFTVLISIAFVTVVSAGRVTGGSVILKKIVDHQNQRDVSKYLIPCTATFIEEYFESPDQISFFLPDMWRDHSVTIKLLMNKLCIPNVIYTLNVSLINVAETYDALTNVVILSETGIALEANDSSFINYCEHDCNFIIVLTNLFTDEESFLTEAGTLVQQMSLRSIFRLEILASVGDSVLHASSLPVWINESFALAEPALLGRCEQQATGIRWQRFANKTKASLDASTIDAAMFNNFPFTIFDNDTNYFGGVEGAMVEEIARSMQLKLNRQTIEWMHGTSRKTEIQLRLHNRTNDLLFGGLLWDFSQKVAYLTCYGMVRVSWLIPKTNNISLSGLITPFGAKVWYAIICVLIVGGLVRLFFIRDITFLAITGLIFGVPVSQPTRHSSRILFISWTLFGFFITQLYLESLAGSLIISSDEQMDTIWELANSGLMIGGTQRFADLLETPDKAVMDDHGERMIREKFLVFEQEDYSRRFLNLVEGRDTGIALLAMLNLTNSYSSTVGYAHIIKETVGNYPLSFVTRQDFPYLKEFNYKIQVLVQAGLVEFWSNMAMLNQSYYKTGTEDEQSQLELDDIAPVFLLLMIGWLGGFCLLIIEVIFYPSKWLL